MKSRLTILMATLLILSCTIKNHVIIDDPQKRVDTDATIIHNMLNSVVKVFCVYVGGESAVPIAHGSGVIIDECDEYLYILTAKHVVPTVEDLIFYVGFSNEEKQETKITSLVEAIAYSQTNDIVLLKVKKLPFVQKNIKYTVAKVASSEYFQEKCPQGIKVYCVGHPLDLDRFITEGLLSQKWYYGDPGEFLFVASSHGIFGNSGGGIFDCNGTLIGIVSRVRAIRPNQGSIQVITWMIITVAPEGFLSRNAFDNPDTDGGQ